MNEWYVQTKKLLRALGRKSLTRGHNAKDNDTAPDPLKGYADRLAAAESSLAWPVFR
jgi:hypothetical protein